MSVRLAGSVGLPEMGLHYLRGGSHADVCKVGGDYFQRFIFVLSCGNIT